MHNGCANRQRASGDGAAWRGRFFAITRSNQVIGAALFGLCAAAIVGGQCQRWCGASTHRYPHGGLQSAYLDSAAICANPQQARGRHDLGQVLRPTNTRAGQDISDRDVRAWCRVFAERLTSIFESFTQAGTDTARKFGGTGLGLTISKQLVTLMQGDIKVESTLGVGTAFTVSIPFEISNAQEGTRENEEDIQLDDLKGLNILLVEDNEFNVMVAEETLKSSLPDVKLFTASNGAEAIAVLEEMGKAIDLVLMDIQMPVMNGMEATQKIRASNRDFAQVKIIALTANAFEEDIKKYFRLGMNGYITKPFKIADMMKEIYNVLHHKPHENMQKEEAIIKPSNKEEVFVLHPPITDMSFLNSFAGGKQEKILKYKQMFLSNAPRLFEDIQKSLNQKDYEGVKIAAHSLKPQLGYMGVKEEVSNVFLLEKSAGE